MAGGEINILRATSVSECSRTPRLREGPKAGVMGGKVFSDRAADP